MSALLQRLPLPGRVEVEFFLDGKLCVAQRGDTVLTAVLTLGAQLRETEVGGAPRAGFCFMGACQDCWVLTEDGQRLRGCTTLVDDGMRLVSGARR